MRRSRSILSRKREQISLASCGPVGLFARHAFQFLCVSSLQPWHALAPLEFSATGNLVYIL